LGGWRRGGYGSAARWRRRRRRRRRKSNEEAIALVIANPREEKEEGGEGGVLSQNTAKGKLCAAALEAWSTAAFSSITLCGVRRGIIF
jgi:hypothetical protein